MDNAVRDAIVLNGYNLATQGNGTLDQDWPACVGCAILSRSFGRTNTTAPAICSRCFDRYCWNGTVDTRAPAQYMPSMKLKAIKVDISEARVEKASAMLLLLTSLLVLSWVSR